MFACGDFSEVPKGPCGGDAAHVASLVYVTLRSLANRAGALTHLPSPSLLAMGGLGMRRIVLLACAAMGLALASVVGAQAAAPAIGNSRPPQAVLMQGKKVLQVGSVGTFCWHEPPNFPL